jgi:hypothetical protein
VAQRRSQRDEMRELRIPALTGACPHFGSTTSRGPEGDWACARLGVGASVRPRAGRSRSRPPCQAVTPVRGTRGPAHCDLTRRLSFGLARAPKRPPGAYPDKLVTGPFTDAGRQSQDSTMPKRRSPAGTGQQRSGSNPGELARPEGRRTARKAPTTFSRAAWKAFPIRSLARFAVFADRRVLTRVGAFRASPRLGIAPVSPNPAPNLVRQAYSTAQATALNMPSQLVRKTLATARQLGWRLQRKPAEPAPGRRPPCFR